MTNKRLSAKSCFVAIDLHSEVSEHHAMIALRTCMHQALIGCFNSWAWQAHVLPPSTCVTGSMYIGEKTSVKGCVLGQVSLVKRNEEVLVQSGCLGTGYMSMTGSGTSSMSCHALITCAAPVMSIYPAARACERMLHCASTIEDRAAQPSH